MNVGGWILYADYRHEQTDHETNGLFKRFDGVLWVGSYFFTMTCSLDELSPETKCTFLYYLPHQLQAGSDDQQC